MFGLGPDVKRNVNEAIKNTIAEFEARDNFTTKLGEPVIGYADVRNPLFDMFFTRGLSKHPKEILQAGYTVVVYFLPYDEDAVRENLNSKEPGEKWKKAFFDTMWLSMRINANVRQVFEDVGRLTSLMNVPTDWDEKRHIEGWSHKLAAFAAGIGEIGPAGCFRTPDGRLGRVGGIITDGMYAADFDMLSNEQLETVYQQILTDSCFQEAENVECSDEMISACPGCAITKDGIDRAKCQEYCKTVNEHTPSPDVCGKCFRF